MIEPSEVADRLFPEEEVEDDFLCGYQDFTGGQTTRYFQNLTEQDRELVQTYAVFEITPINVDVYVREVAESYALNDPNRTDELENIIAHEKMGRAMRYMKLFKACDFFFPKIIQHERCAFDENDKPNGIEIVKGWSNLWTINSSVTDYKTKAQESIELFKLVDQFLDDPNAVPKVIDQTKILADYQTVTKSNPAD